LGQSHIVISLETAALSLSVDLCSPRVIILSCEAE